MGAGNWACNSCCKPADPPIESGALSAAAAATSGRQGGPVTAGSSAVLFVVGLAAAAVGFVLVVFLANRLLAPHHPDPEKGSPYECGMEPAGAPWRRVNVRFASVALLFVLFDVEAVLLFAVATRLRGSLAGLLEAGAFAALLALGLAYAWRKGALEWRS